MQVQRDVEADGNMHVLFFVATKWKSLCIKTFQSAFAPKSLDDILAGGFSDEEEADLLKVHLQFAVCTVKRFLEFSLLFESFPWAFHRILFDDVKIASDTLKNMQSEWQFLLRLERETPKLHDKWPVKQINPLRWQVYREVMTFCEARSFSATDGVKLAEMRELVAAWVPRPMSTLGCDAVFKELRSAETRHSTNKNVSVEQIQAVSVKAVNKRYEAFETIEPRAAEVQSITPGCFVKRTVFDASRATAACTGLPRFNVISKLPTPSPHFLSRRGLNLWQALKKSNGSTSNFWTSQLVRSAMAI